MTENNESLSKPLNASIKEDIEPFPSRRQQLNPDRTSVNDVLIQSVLTVDVQRYSKLRRRYKIISGCACICIFLGILMIAIFPFLIKGMIQSKAIQQVILSKDNEKLWAHFPGDSLTQIVRNYTFFDFVNTKDVFLYGAKPKFREVSGYKINQLDDYVNITYSDEGRKATYMDWLHFSERSDSRNISDNVRILNIGKLAYWFNLKTARPTILLQQGIATLFVTIETQVINIALAQGISKQYLTDNITTFRSLFIPAKINQENWEFLWDDYAYGLSNQNNLRIWVNATITSFLAQAPTFSTDALILKDYFGLSDSQLYILLETMKNYIDSLKEVAFANHYCENLPDSLCTGHHLASLQMASSYVTNNTPPVKVIVPEKSVCSANTTCAPYFPQLSAYYEEVYMKKHPDSDPYLKFDADKVSRWFDYNQSSDSTKDYNTNQDSLLHIGNLDAIWGNGTLYDLNNDRNRLRDIMDRFDLQSQKHALVLWNWIKYFYEAIVKQYGTHQHVGISSLFASTLYDNFQLVQDQLQMMLLTKIIHYELNKTSCVELFSVSLGVTDQHLINTLCNRYDIHQASIIEQLILICKHKYAKQWQELKNFNLEYSQMDDFCDAANQLGFGGFYESSRVFLNNYYDCSETPTPYCSDYQLAVKQWAHSAVTRKPIPLIDQQFPATTTIADWFPGVMPFQYYHFTRQFPQRKFPNISVHDAYSKLNFDNWFCSSQAQKDYLNKSIPEEMKEYMRYQVIFVAMEGMTVTRPAREFMFGYKDALLQKIRTMYIPFGGDPSTPEVIAFNDPNITEPSQSTMSIEITTGKDNINELNLIKKINNLTYLTIDKNKFNGNQTITEKVSPWIGEDFFYGTNAKFFSPNQFSNPNLSIYIPNIQRYGSGNQFIPYERFGFDLRKAYLPDSIYLSTNQSDINSKYYQSYHAVFNETSVAGVPFFLTKNHFMNTSNWANLVDIYNENDTIHYVDTSDWDDTFLIVEPYSGVPFQATLYLQSNYHFEPDELFRFPSTIMLPVFSVYRSANLTEERANFYLGQLKTGLAASNWVLYFGISIVVLFFILLVYALFQFKKAGQVYRKSSILNNSSIVKKVQKPLAISMQAQKRMTEEVEQTEQPPSGDLHKVEDQEQQ